MKERIRLGSVAVAIAVVVAGCGFDSRGDTIDALPCDEPTQYVNLGRPVRAIGEAAEITVADTGTIWASLSGPSPPGGIWPGIDTAALYFGRTSQPPSYDPQSGVVANTLDGNGAKMGGWVHLHYEGFAEVPFPDADRYWILTSQGMDLELYTCAPSVISDPKGSPLGGTVGVELGGT